MEPRVSVIGISFEHAAFIEKAIDSLLAQDYPNLEVILMDDGSKDESAALLKKVSEGREDIQLILHDQNLGYTKTFNEGLALATGDYIIDFALDDVMLPGFISKSVEALEKMGPDYGVCFCNADYIDAHDKVLGNHYDQLKAKGMIEQMPTGDIFEMLMRRYFICTPTMVIRKNVFERIGGYDPELAYEDFDFWIRSGRYFKYHYLDAVLMQKRKIATSMSANRLKHWQNQQLESVYKVCEKAFALCKTRQEIKALKGRLAYEYRQSMRSDHGDLAKKYLHLLKQTGAGTFLLQFWGILIRLGFNPKRT